jgi:hypothetical protein
MVVRPRSPQLEVHYDKLSGTVTFVPEADDTAIQTTWLTSDTTIDLTEAR